MTSSTPVLTWEGWAGVSLLVDLRKKGMVKEAKACIRCGNSGGLARRIHFFYRHSLITEQQLWFYFCKGGVYHNHLSLPFTPKSKSLFSQA